MKKRWVYWGFVAAVICGLFCAVYTLTASLTRYVDNMARLEKDTVIVIDAGHGDFDPGAVSGNVQEKQINLSIALALRDYFEAGGYTVVMTRTGDTTLAQSGPDKSTNAKTADTHNRAALADSFHDSVLISIHQNAYADNTQHGTQVFYGVLNPRSEALAQAVQQRVCAALQPDNRREIKRGTDSIYLLMHTKAPTILVECGFITNPQEREQLLDETYQRQVAYAVYMGYTEYESGADSQPVGEP